MANYTVKIFGKARSSRLMLAMASKSEVLKLALQNLERICNGKHTLRFRNMLNYQQRPTSSKWKTFACVMKNLSRLGVVPRSSVALWGSTPLSHAAGRGDVEIVKLLLKYGADPHVKNDIGMDSFEICEMLGPFPRVTDALKSVNDDDDDDDGTV